MGRRQLTRMVSWGIMVYRGIMEYGKDQEHECVSFDFALALLFYFFVFIFPSLSVLLLLLNWLI